MNILNKLRYWHHARRCRKYARRSAALHAEMREKMLPYIREIKRLDAMAENERILAAMALNSQNNSQTSSELFDGCSKGLVEQ